MSCGPSMARIWAGNSASNSSAPLTPISLESRSNRSMRTSAKQRTPPAGGVRCFALVRIDRFDLLSRDIGVRGAEELLALFPAQIRAMLGPHDIAGHFGAASLLLLLERGNARDAEAWSESLVERVGKHAFPVGERRVSISCTVGLALVANSDPNLDAAINDAQESARRGAERGGNRVVAKERVDQDARVLAYDQVWVKHIKAALTENRFHLVH